MWYPNVYVVIWAPSSRVFATQNKLAKKGDIVQTQAVVHEGPVLTKLSTEAWGIPRKRKWRGWSARATNTRKWKWIQLNGSRMDPLS